MSHNANVVHAGHNFPRHDIIDTCPLNSDSNILKNSKPYEKKMQDYSKALVPVGGGGVVG
jgi:hypothetical protein